MLLEAILFGSFAVKAYTVQSGDTFCGIAQKIGVSCETLKQDNPKENYNLIFPGEQIKESNDVFGVALPEDSYDTYLTAALSSSATDIYVSRLPTTTESIYTIFASDGVTVSEKVYCTGTTSTPSKHLTGCVRGISTTFVNGVIDETAGTGVSHSKNSRIAITDNINFTGKALNILFGGQNTGSSTFSVGTASTNTLQLFLDSNGKYLRAYNNGTNPFVRYNTTTNEWQFSDDGINTTNFATTSADGISASSTASIGITDSYIHLVPSSTWGIKNDNGAAIDTTDALIWTGGQTFGSVTTTAELFVSTTLRINSTLNVGATSTLATTTINGIDVKNVLSTSTQDADSYHTHVKLADKVYIGTTDITVTTTVETVLASTTIAAGTLKGNNTIHARVFFSDVDDSGVHNLFLNLKYGTTTSTLTITGAAETNLTGFYDVYLTGNGSTSAQDVAHNFSVNTASATSVTWHYAGTGSMSEDSSIAKTLQITARTSNTGLTFVAAQVIIEAITNPNSN